MGDVEENEDVNCCETFAFKYISTAAEQRLNQKKKKKKKKKKNHPILIWLNVY